MSARAVVFNARAQRIAPVATLFTNEKSSQFTGQTVILHVDEIPGGASFFQR